MFRSARRLSRAALVLILLNEVRGLIVVAAVLYGFGQHPDNGPQSLLTSAAQHYTRIAAEIWSG